MGVRSSLQSGRPRILARRRSTQRRLVRVVDTATGRPDGNVHPKKSDERVAPHGSRGTRERPERGARPLGWSALRRTHGGAAERGGGGGAASSHAGRAQSVPRVCPRLVTTPAGAKDGRAHACASTRGEQAAQRAQRARAGALAHRYARASPHSALPTPLTGHRYRRIPRHRACTASSEGLRSTTEGRLARPDRSERPRLRRGAPPGRTRARSTAAASGTRGPVASQTTSR